MQGLRVLKGVGFLDDTPQQLAAFLHRASVAPSRLPSVTLSYLLTPMRFQVRARRAFTAPSRRARMCLRARARERVWSSVFVVGDRA